MSLEALPAELLHLVCNVCDIKRIKTLRLTSRALCAIADEHLFPEVGAFFTRDSIEAIESIAANPRFRKPTTSLWFQGDRMDPRYSSFAAWDSTRIRQAEFAVVSNRETMDEILELDRLKAQAKTRSDYKRIAEREAALKERRTELKTAALKDMTRDDLTERHNHYCSLLQDEQRLLQSGNIRASLRALFESCPNLYEIIFSMAHCLRVSTTKKPFGKALITPWGDSDYRNQGVAAMEELIKAASDANYSPRSLRFGSVSYSLVNREGIDLLIPSFLSKLETLHWHFATPFWNEDGDVDEVAIHEIAESIEEGDFKSFIQHATNLRYLLLEMPWNTSESITPRLSAMLGDITWPHLKSLSVGTVNADSDHLSSLLLRHAKTLQSLRLGQVDLIGGLWSECLEAVAGKLPRLKYVELRGEFVDDEDVFYWFGHLDNLRGNNYERQIAKYIINGGDVFPEAPNPWEGIDDMWEGDDEEESLLATTRETLWGLHPHLNHPVEDLKWEDVVPQA